MHFVNLIISTGMTVTMLGTGTPFPDGARFGSAILVEAGGQRLLFDCGRGAVIRLSQVGRTPSEIDGVFLTHLHSDHIVGLPDLWLTGWFLKREPPLRVWGPAGTRSMAEHLVEAYAFDLNVREGPSAAAELDARDIEPGVAYNEGGVRVTAFLVDHGTVRPALGYRIDYDGHSVVISGDTRFSDRLVEVARGTDCLIHAAWSPNASNPTPPAQRSIASAEDAARVFSLVGPKLGVIYHYEDSTGIMDAVRAGYGGRVVIAHDLMSIQINGSAGPRVD
jgi:ribonuclease Z